MSAANTKKKVYHVYLQFSELNFATAFHIIFETAAIGRLFILAVRFDGIN